MSHSLVLSELNETFHLVPGSGRGRRKVVAREIGTDKSAFALFGTCGAGGRGAPAVSFERVSVQTVAVLVVLVDYCMHRLLLMFPMAHEPWTWCMSRCRRIGHRACDVCCNLWF